ncbi:MAG TPA: 5'-nucleotidase C-terminal domain-containing protein [Pyrinomonadaceae bacterium]|jgi:2',3'-cyclic-nucleotide 2'-phosphodiesterase/3'-nucleotidase|nr:5'-nucleotidase C-terminal domain-containing protein [Pyrinomonadaceae bacterium]
MKRITVAILNVSLTLFVIAASGTGQTKLQRAHVVILSTTDMHGRVFPIDYYTNKYDNVGIAKVATLVKEARKNDPDLLLVDSGDTIQGTPLEYFHNKRNNTPPDPMMLAMNALHYDSMTVGNHEYNFGLQVLEKARREAQFPWLSANTYDTESDKPHSHYQPYIVKEVQGVKIGILGLTTPGIPNWENKPNYEGLEFHETVSEAKKWVELLRTGAKVDVVVIAMHMGIEEDLRTGIPSPSQVPNENAAIAIARQVPGIDVILMGHTHREVPSLTVNTEFSFEREKWNSGNRTPVYDDGVLLTQANRWASHIARVDLYLQKNASGRWQVIMKSARTIPVTEKTEVDPEIAKIGESYDKETQAWLSRAIGESSEELTANGCRFHDSAIIDLIQRVQLEAGNADVSMAACFNDRAHISKGAVTVRDIAGLYEYENTLVTLELTGQQLKDALEHSAEYFREYEQNKTLAQLVDQRVPGYNFDVAEGVNYDIDLTKPFGQRIQNLKFKGQPLSPTQKLRVVTNNYRVNGGGGYDMFKNAPVVYRSSAEVRELIIDWVEKHKTIPTETDNNWRIVGAQ